jgi:spermidine synthase
VDIDPDLVALVRQQLPWDRRADLRVATGDARAWRGARRAASADLVICDVFVGARTPAHLTSVEFAAEAARVVRLSGMYAVNVSDGRGLRYTRSQVATVAQVFQHVALVAEPGVLRGRRFGNLVLVAGHEALPVDELARRAHRDPAMARVLAGDELRRWAAGAAVVHDAEAQDSPAPPESLF